MLPNDFPQLGYLSIYAGSQSHRIQLHILCYQTYFDLHRDTFQSQHAPKRRINLIILTDNFVVNPDL